jgi:hypothetical protein
MYPNIETKAAIALPFPSRSHLSVSNVPVFVLLVALLALASQAASAQVTYGGDSVIATGFGNAANIAADNYGDIYVFDIFAGSIYWFAPDSTGNYSTTQTIATGLTNVQYLSVNAEGTLLFAAITDGSNSSLNVYEKNSGAYSLLESVNPGVSAADPVAVDSTANIALTDENNSTLYFGNYTSLPTSNFSNLGLPGYFPTYAAAVSPDDNIFLAGSLGSDYSMIEFAKTGSSSWTPRSILSVGTFSADYIGSLAMDGFSNLYAAVPALNEIAELADTHDGINTLSTALGSTSPNSVASDRFGNLSHVDSSNTTLALDVRYPAIDFGTVAVGSSVTKSLFVTVNAPSAVDAGVFIGNLVLTPATADFSENYLASTCSNPSTNTWYCSVPVVFSPTGPGIRTDAMEIKSGGSVLTTVYLSGKATGSAGPQAYTSQIIGQTGVPLNGVTIDSATGVAADPSGNIYVLDQASLQIVKYTRTGPGAYSGSPLRISGLSLTTPGLNYIAVDAAGNIYTDQGTSIVEISPSGEATAMNIGISLGAVSGLYADSYGTLHISDNVNGHVVMVPVLGTAVVEKSVSGAKFAGLANSPGSFTSFSPIAVAPFGPTFVADTQNQKLDEFGFPLAGFQIPDFTFAPRQMALDLNQNLIFADPASSTLVGYNLTGLSTFHLPVAPPQGCAPDGLIQTEAGDYVASASDCGEVIVYPASMVHLPPSITASFSPSSIAFGGSSTLTITITNPNINLALTGVGFNDNLPTGLSIGNTAFGNTCGQIISASPNSASLTGVSMAANTSCTVTIPIVPTEYGAFQDSTGVITSNEEGNGAAASATLTVTASSPTVTRISPATGLPTGGTAVTITGTNFNTNAAGVNFGATAATNVIVVNATKITATSPSGTGTVDVTVTTPSGTSATNPADQFAYAAPNFVVNTEGDDPSGIAGNCPAGGSTTACTLRDALAAASTTGSGNITFSPSIFNPARTIVASNGTLNIPSLTSISGATSGSGGALRNLVTISGGSTSNGFPVFTIASGVAGASIANLTLTESGASIAGGIQNAGSLNVQSCTITGMAGGSGGAIYNNGGTMEISDSTISGSISGHYGGALYSTSGTVNVIGSTISGNAAILGAGGILLTGGTVNVIGSTVSGNFAGLYGPGIYNTHGTLTVTNSIVSGDQQGTQASPGNYDDIDDLSGDTTFSAGNNGGNLIGYYNTNSAAAPSIASNLAPLGPYSGPTQTMLPQPGSAAICGGTLANATTANLTTDQRGLPLDPVCPAGANLVDSGAVQSNYALSFSTQPGSATAFSPITPAPVVELTESGNLATAASSSAAMTDLDAALAGSTSASFAAGYASFGNLIVNTAETSDTLTATLALNPALTPALNLTATSNPFSVAQTSQTIAFGPIANQVAGTTINVSATASSGLPVTFTNQNPTPVCTVTTTGSNTASVTLNTYGFCYVVASQGGDSTFNAATSVLQAFGVAHATQTISFGGIAGQNAGTAIPLSASASSTLPVSFASLSPTVCTVSGTSASLIAYGECFIQAGQAGDAEYAAATSVTQSFGVAHGMQTITFPNPGSQVAATMLSLSATATSGLPVAFTSLTPSICTVAGTNASLLAYGTCTIQASQNGNNGSGASEYFSAPTVNQSFQVTHGSQTITFGPIATQTAGTTLPLSATANSGLTVSFVSLTPGVCTVSGTNASLIAFGTCTIQAQQPGNAEYLGAPAVNQSFGVAHESQTLNFPQIGKQTAASNINLSATASSGLTVSFVSLSPAVCTVSGTLASLIAFGTCTIQAQQTGNAQYLGAPPVNQSFGVGHAPQAITFGPIASQPVNTTLPLSATASSGLTVSFTSLTPAVCTVSGTTASLNTAGNCVIQANQSGNSVYLGAAPVNQNLEVTE